MCKIKDRDKIIRKITYHLYKDQVHQQTSVRGIYKHNRVTGEDGVDPFKHCKTIKSVKEVLLTSEREELTKIFKDDEYSTDFVLVKINKRNLSFFQQIFPYELNNSVRFIREVE